MGKSKGGQWWDITWNPFVGCRKKGPGCQNCFAIREVWRLAGNPRVGHLYQGLVRKTESGALEWTGETRFLRERLEVPLQWKKPRRIFVCSLSDLFHERNSGWDILAVHDVIRRTPQHTYMVPTKRPHVARAFYLAAPEVNLDPPPNLWIGTSVENQQMADRRISWLLQIPAAIRFLSVEPLLGPLDLDFMDVDYPEHDGHVDLTEVVHHPSRTGQMIHWVIAGGETGPRGRPCHPDWASDLRHQCIEAGIPFWWKQWGAYSPTADKDRPGRDIYVSFEGHVAKSRQEMIAQSGTRWTRMYATGRLEGPKRSLDGREWNELPRGAIDESPASS